MISGKHRFHGRNALNAVYRHGRSVRVEHMALRVTPSKRADYRLAVVVSKKVSKSAVVRNRIRRRLYEIIRLLKDEQRIDWPFDMVLVVYDDRAAKVSSEELREEVVRLLSKTHII